jgi:hypothetical protein
VYKRQRGLGDVYKRQVLKEAPGIWAKVKGFFGIK